MKLDSIRIKNFKSIDNLTIDVQKYGNSFTTMFLGVNEAGKSNLLTAMSFFKTPEETFNYDLMRNQKNDSDDYVDLYFDISFDTKSIYLMSLRKKLINGEKLNFEIKNITKNVYLKKGESVFQEDYNYDIDNLVTNLYIKKIDEEKFEILENKYEDVDFRELTLDVFNEYFDESIRRLISTYEPRVSFWKPSDKYLISTVDLNAFQENIYSNIPLKNMFALCTYTNKEQIQEQITQISSIQSRRRLMTTLSKETTKYIKSIWKHDIEVDVEITESKICNILIKDDGKHNEYNFYEMNSRSEGFKQFISLILSLSIETKRLNFKKRLILIDEPETHLHPSGIRDLGRELLSIGENNYLFISTHSPFIIDKNNRERHIIIKKDGFANTIKKEVNDYEDLRDDEVLREAFGLNVYKDLLNPHRILVEGASDRLILQKAFEASNLEYGITNGNGSNIVQTASKFNLDDINIFVLLDDDKDGQKYKKSIIKIGGVFNENNVCTLKDLVEESPVETTIEDFLGKNYIESQFKKLFTSEMEGEISFELNEETPFIEQIKIKLLQCEGVEKSDISTFLEKLKISISKELSLPKTTWKTKFPLLNELVMSIEKKFNK